MAQQNIMSGRYEKVYHVAAAMQQLLAVLCCMIMVPQNVNTAAAARHVDGRHQLGGHLSASTDEQSLYVFPPGVTDSSQLTSSYFTFQGLRNPGPPPAAGVFKSTRVDKWAFPALKEMGVGAALLEYGAGALNPPHYHLIGTELLHVLQGSLVVGLIDEHGRLFNQTLLQGDVFMFPETLIHYQVNPSTSAPAVAFSSYSSPNPAPITVASSLFASGVPSPVLAQAFGVPISTISQLQAAFSDRLPA